MDVNRKNYLDYLRIIATFAVILIHIFTTARTDFPVHTDFEDVIVLIVVQCLHFCVPIFLMISGSLFLKQKKDIPLNILLKKYVLKYIVVILTFGYAMAIIEELFKNGLRLEILYKAFINVLLGNTWEHMWYLYMLVGVLALIPFIKIICLELENNESLKKYFIALGILSNFIYPMIKIIFDFEIPITIPLFSNYIFFLIIGELIDEKKINIDNKINILGIIISFLIIISLNVLHLYFDYEFLTKIGGYDSVFILILSISIFSLYKNKESKLKSNAVILFLSNYSFGVYLIHMFWINIIYKLFNFNIFGELYFAKVLIIYLIVVLLSYITSFIMKKIPLVRKYV